jgi:hypothetical protein
LTFTQFAALSGPATRDDGATLVADHLRPPAGTATTLPAEQRGRRSAPLGSSIAERERVVSRPATKKHDDVAQAILDTIWVPEYK